MTSKQYSWAIGLMCNVPNNFKRKTLKVVIFDLSGFATRFSIFGSLLFSH